MNALRSEVININLDETDFHTALIQAVLNEVQITSLDELKMLCTPNI